MRNLHELDNYELGGFVKSLLMELQNSKDSPKIEIFMGIKGGYYFYLSMLFDKIIYKIYIFKKT